VLNPEIKNIELEKVESLFVRACKGANSINRILRLRKHFYFQDQNIDVELTHIHHILFRIINKTKPLSGEALAIQLDPRRDYAYEKATMDDYNYRLVEVLVYHIRFIDPKDLHGFIVPTRFKRQEANKVVHIHQGNVTHTRDALNLQSKLPQSRYQVGVQTTTKIERPSKLKKFINTFKRRG